MDLFEHGTGRGKWDGEPNTTLVKLLPFAKNGDSVAQYNTGIVYNEKRVRIILANETRPHIAIMWKDKKQK